jgi:hypothetical protein
MHHHNLADFDGDGQFDATDIVIFTEKSSKLSCWLTSSRNPEGQHVQNSPKKKPIPRQPFSPSVPNSRNPRTHKPHSKKGATCRNFGRMLFWGGTASNFRFSAKG